LSVPVDLDDGGVDHSVFHVGFIRAGFEKPNKDIGFDPIAIPLEDGVPVAEQGRQITPWAAGADDPQNGLDEAPVVGPAASRACPDNAAPFSPIGRPSVQSAPSEA
jgi:hypothetical protein